MRIFQSSDHDGGDGNEADGDAVEEVKIHHKPVVKQTSLPQNFTFNIRPPSPDADGNCDQETSGKHRPTEH